MGIVDSQDVRVYQPSAVLLPALQIGALSGGAGVLVGATAGVIRSAPPLLFAAASGFQFFALGSTFWVSRTLILNQDGVVNWLQTLRGGDLRPANTEPQTPSDLTMAGALAGAITGGTVAALTRGRRNVIPGTIVFSIFAGAGQGIVNMLQQKEEVEKKEQSNFLQRLSRSRYSPMTSLSDDEYARMLREKILRVDVDIALIDEKIEKLLEMESSTDENGDL